MPSVPSLGATVGASTGHQATTSPCALEAVYLNSATAERGVAVKARDPGDEDGMRALVVDADLSWWGGERCMRETHIVTNRRGHSDQTDAVTSWLFLFKIRETKPMLPYAEGDCSFTTGLPRTGGSAWVTEEDTGLLSCLQMEGEL